MSREIKMNSSLLPVTGFVLFLLFKFIRIFYFTRCQNSWVVFESCISVPITKGYDPSPGIYDVNTIIGGHKSG